MAPQDPADEPAQADDPALDRIYDLAEAIAREIPLRYPDWDTVERAAADLRNAVAAYRQRHKGERHDPHDS